MRKLGGVVLNESPWGKKQEFRVMMAFHWLSCQDSQFLHPQSTLVRFTFLNFHKSSPRMVQP